MSTSRFISHCPVCGASPPPESRFCPQCGRQLATDETLEQPADAVMPDPGLEQPADGVMPDPAIAPRPQPAEFPPTVHQIHRRPLGIDPVATLGGLGGIALLVAIILLVAAALIDGVVLLVLAAVLLALFLAGVRREPDAPASRLVRRWADRVRSLAGLGAVSVRAWVHAGVNLVLIRRRQRRLRGELRDRLAPLGEAVFQEDQQRAEALKQQAAELEQELHEAGREASALIGHARRQIEYERAAVEPTQSFPPVG